MITIIVCSLTYGLTLAAASAFLYEVFRLRAALSDEQLERGKAEERARRSDGLAIETIGNTRRALAQRINELQTCLTAELRATLDHDCEEQVMQRMMAVSTSSPSVKATYCPGCERLSTESKEPKGRGGGGGGAGGVIVLTHDIHGEEL